MQKMYDVPLTVEVNCVFLSMVMVAGESPGVTVIATFAFAPLEPL